MAIGGKEFVIDYTDGYPSLKVDITITSPDPKSTRLPCSLKDVLIDTGSDFTLVSKNIIQKLKLVPTGNEFLIAGFDDDKDTKRKPIKFYSCKLKIDDVIETVIEVGGIDAEPLIGMNLLSKLYMLTNGPNGTFEMVNKDNYKIPSPKVSK